MVFPFLCPKELRALGAGPVFVDDSFGPLVFRRHVLTHNLAGRNSELITP
jgi:hypothetical protein